MEGTGNRPLRRRGLIGAVRASAPGLRAEEDREDGEYDEREDCGGNYPPDDDRCQRALHFTTNPGGSGHGKKSRGVGDGGCKDASDGRGNGGRRRRRGLEARAKVKIDKLEAIVSSPFIENLVQHVLTGPLASHVLHGQAKAEGLNDPECYGHGETLLSLAAQPLAPTAHLEDDQHSSLVAAEHDDHGQSWAAHDYPGSGEVRIQGRRASSSSPEYAIVGDHGRTHSGEVPPLAKPHSTGYRMKPVVFLKVCIGRR